MISGRRNMHRILSRLWLSWFCLGWHVCRTKIAPNEWLSNVTNPEGPARHLDVPGQKLSPHCLETIFDSQLPSPKSSPKMPPKLSLPHRRGHFFLFQNYPCGEGNCEAIRETKIVPGQFLPRDIKMSRRAHGEERKNDPKNGPKRLGNISSTSLAA